MSGIAGLFDLRGSPVDPTPLEGIGDRLRYRAADGMRSRVEGPIAMLHGHFWTTPEEVGERQPIGSSPGGPWIVADARIDNREELIAGVGPRVGGSVTDAELILLAYERWGAECCRHLVGDFAFALWDGRVRRLLLARDPMGIRQLYYIREGETLIFASTIGGVLAALPRTPPLNSHLIRRFLQGSFRPWLCETAYQRILRLPSGHYLTASREGVTGNCYYDPGLRPETTSASDAEWIDRFREVFDEAVRCRLRATGPVAVVTGGGLDSSAIACVAHELAGRQGGRPEVRLYSSVFDKTPRADERACFDQVRRHCTGTAAVTLPSDHLWAMQGWEGRNGGPLDEPRVGLLDGMAMALFRHPADDGCRVVLAGEGANQVLADLTYHTPAALRLVGWRDLVSELPHFRAATGMSLPELLVRGYLQPLLPAPARRILRRTRSLMRQARPWVREAGAGQGVEPAPVDERFDPPRWTIATPRPPFGVVWSGFNLARYSMMDVMAASAGVEWRLPYLDRRVADVLLDIPYQLRTWRGQDRIALREVMRGRMPESVRLRRWRADFSELNHRGLKGKRRQAVRRLLDNCRSGELGFVDSAMLKRAFEAYWKGESDGRDLHTFLCLEDWLRTTRPEEEGRWEVGSGG